MIRRHPRSIRTDTLVPYTTFFRFLELILENGALGLLSRIVRARPQWAPRVARIIAGSIGGDASTMVADCHRAFSSVRLVRFNEMEYEMPAENGPRAPRELYALIARQEIQEIARAAGRERVVAIG